LNQTLNIKCHEVRLVAKFLHAGGQTDTAMLIGAFLQHVFENATQNGILYHTEWNTENMEVPSLQQTKAQADNMKKPG
jgi:hypothetical protein